MKPPVYALESDLASAVERYLASRGDVMLTKTDAASSSPKNRGRVVAGTGDYVGLVYPSGRHLEIEEKRTRGARRPKQLERQGKVRAMGGVYEVCESVADVQRAIERAN